MIKKITIYTLVFLLGAMTMASNPDLYEKARYFFGGVDNFVQTITQKEDRDPEIDPPEDD